MVRAIDKASHGDVSKTKSDSLRASFKQLSSGVKSRGSDIAKVGSELKAGDASGGASSKFTELIRDLNDAVSFSSMALDSLDKIAKTSDNGESDSEVVTEFSEDLSKLRASIGDTLGMLKSRMSTAEVIRENLISAESRLKDVDEARSHAQSAKVDIVNNTSIAIDSHSRLEAINVLNLLEE